MNELTKALLTPMKELVANAVRRFFADGEATQYVTAQGTITADYVSGLPKVKFDKDDAASGKTYCYVSSYTPIANDRVLLIRVGHDWVILGKVVNA